MRGLPFVIAATAALLTVSACDSHKTQQATPQAATTTSASEPSIKEQADRYLAIIKPANEALARIAARTANWRGTLSREEFDSIMKPLAAALETSNTALLRADWTPTVRADIHSLAQANAAWMDDLSTAFDDPDAGAVISRDIAASHAAANAVRADLGLPAARPFDRGGAHL